TRVWDLVDAGPKIENTRGRERDLLHDGVRQYLGIGHARGLSKKTRPLREGAARVVLRWTNYLEQARTRAEFLAENRSGRNYRVPPEGQPPRASARRSPGLWPRTSNARRELRARRRDAADCGRPEVAARTRHGTPPTERPKPFLTSRSGSRTRLRACGREWSSSLLHGFITPFATSCKS